MSEATALVMDEGALLLVQRAEGGLWSRFWEFPTVNLAGANPACRVRVGQRFDLAAGVESLTGICVTPGPELRTVAYSVTKHRVTLHVHAAQRRGGELRAGPGIEAARWVNVVELSHLTLTSPARKLAAWIATDPERVTRLPSR